MAKISWNTASNAKNVSRKKNETAKKNLKVGDTVITLCPYTRRKNRPGLIVNLVKGGYIIQYQSTSGGSCDGQSRKVFERKDGSCVVYTGSTLEITYEQVKKFIKRK